jgi:hypothetical protein
VECAKEWQCWWCHVHLIALQMTGSELCIVECAREWWCWLRWSCLHVHLLCSANDRPWVVHCRICHRVLTLMLPCASVLLWKWQDVSCALYIVPESADADAVYSALEMTGSELCILEYAREWWYWWCMTIYPVLEMPGCESSILKWFQSK